MAKQIVPLTPTIPPTTAIQDPAARQFASAVADMLRSAQSAEYFVRQMEGAVSKMYGPGGTPQSILNWLFSSELYQKLSSAIEKVDVDSKSELLAAIIAEQDARAQDFLDEREARINEIAAEAAERILLGVDVNARIEAAAESISEKTLELIALTDEVLDKLRFERNITDATIVINPTTGEITLSAVDAFRDETITSFNQVSIDLNAQDARITSAVDRITQTEGGLTVSQSEINQLSDQITLKASIAYVDEAITTAVIDPSQLAELGGIFARLNSVELDLSAVEAAITLKADQLTVGTQGSRLTTAEARLDGAEAAIELTASAVLLTDTIGRVDSAEIRLDGAEAAIVLKATSIEMNGVADRVTTAEINIDGLQGEVRLVAAQGSGALFSEAGAETMLETLVSLDTTRDRNRVNTGTLALTETKLSAQIEEGVSAQAEQRAVLIGVVNENTALIVEESVARATAEEAVAIQVTGIIARVEDSEAAIITEASARATANEAVASQITVINAEVEDARATISTESVARATADEAITQELGLQISRVDDNEAAIVTESTTRANADEALVTQISGVSAIANARNRTYRQTTEPTGAVSGDVWYNTAESNKPYRFNGSTWVETSDTRVAAAEAAILDEVTVRATNDAALVQAINTAWAITGATQAVSQSGQNLITNWTAAQADRWTQLEAEVFTSGGQTIRAALAEEAQVRAEANGDLFGQYTVKLDLDGYVAGFGLASTSTTAGVGTSEFIVRADKFAVVMPGFGQHVPFAIGNFGVDFLGGTDWGKVAGTGKPVNNATVGADIGTNLTRGGVSVAQADIVASWNKISDGNAATFFNSGGLPGTYIANLQANKILAGALGVSQWISSTNYAAGSAGWAINANGSAEFRNIVARGNIEATSLSAATGTFSGTLTAAAVNAVNTVNIAGEAVVIPRSAYAPGSGVSPYSLSVSLPAQIGGSRTIIASVIGFSSQGSGDNPRATMEVLRGGTVLASGDRTTGVFVLRDTTTSAQTYTLRLTHEGYVGGSWKGISIVVLGTQR